MSHRIHKAKTDPANFGGLVDINLVGLAIGNGWMSPLEQGKYASYLYYHGLLDGDQYIALLDLEDDLIAKVSCCCFFLEIFLFFEIGAVCDEIMFCFLK